MPRTGIGLRSPHHGAVVSSRPAVGFLEAHAENYMGGGGARQALLDARHHYPVSLHGVGLSLGSAEPVDRGHLQRLATLIDAVDPFLVSEHVSWCRLDGIYLNDLLPLPYTEEALGLLAGHVSMVQDHLRRRILMENPSAYTAFKYSPVPEGDFLAELSRRTGCGVLLDVNNLYVNQQNLGRSPLDVMAALPRDSVAEIHLAGHHVANHGGRRILIDDHGSEVAEPVWLLYREATRLFPHSSTLVEWDSHLPSLDRLVAEAVKADMVRLDCLGEQAYDQAG